MFGLMIFSYLNGHNNTSELCQFLCWVFFLSFTD